MKIQRLKNLGSHIATIKLAMVTTFKTHYWTYDGRRIVEV